MDTPKPTLAMNKLHNKTTTSLRMGWFPDENKETLLKLIQKYEIKTVIEIGSFLGESTKFFAEHCEHVYAVDPFKKWEEGIKFGGIDNLPEYFYDLFDFNMKESGVREKITALPVTSKDAFGLFPTLTADLIYIDGTHDYENVKQDIELWKNRANIILCGDDYDNNWQGLRKAVDEYEKEVIGRVWIIPT